MSEWPMNIRINKQQFDKFDKWFTNMPTCQIKNLKEIQNSSQLNSYRIHRAQKKICEEG